MEGRVPAIATTSLGVAAALAVTGADAGRAVPSVADVQCLVSGR